MSKEEYLNQLHKYLRKLPKKDYDDVMDYFEEYFQETDEAGAQKLIAELGTPKEAAHELIANLLDKKIDSAYVYNQDNTNTDSSTKRSSKWSIFWIACLSILAVPVAAPLLFALIMLLFCAVICVAIALICVFILAFCLLLVGGKLFIRGLFAITTSISGFALVSGYGLLTVGLSILLTILTIYLCKWCALLFIKLAHWISNRKRGKRA